MQNSLAILILRLGVGGMMLVGHGWGKLVGFTELQATFPDPLGIGPGFSLALAIIAEVLCAFALILGLGTRFVAMPILVTMLLAAFVVHGEGPWREQELALLYAVPLFALVLTGGGDYALDSVRRPRRRPRL